MERTRTRTVVVSGVPGPDVLPVERTIQKLHAHFLQQSSTGGGDVEYPTHLKGVAFVTFDSAEDAERVVRKKCHVLRDEEVPEECPLTVFRFSPQVFFYVTNATVNLSEFDGDLEELIRSLQSAHRSVRIHRPSSAHPEPRHATAEGPFEAIQALREDLIDRAKNVQHGAAEPGLHSDAEGAAEKNAGVRSSVGSDSKRGPAQRSAAEVGDGVSSARARSHSNSSSHATTPDAVDPKLPLPKPVYDTSVSSEKMSATSSLHANCDCSKKCHKTDDSPAVMAKLSGRSHSPSKIASESSKDDGAVAGRPDPTGEAGGDLSAGFSQRAAAAGEDPRDEESAWVDSNTLSYIKQFDMVELERRLRAHGISLRCEEEGSDLTRVSLSGRRPGGTELRSALDHLTALVEYYQTILRVHTVDFESVGSPDRQRVFKVCDDAHAMFKDVLYEVEESCVKVIGPSSDSYLFSKSVREVLEAEEVTYV